MTDEVTVQAVQVDALMWFRSDLRVADNVALCAAAEHGRMTPVFCLDERLLHGRFASGARTQFMLESLRDLDGSLRERGSALVIRKGDPARVLVELSREAGATEVHATADPTPFARARDRRVARALRESGMHLQLHPGAHAVGDLTSLQTKQGRPYTVFTPFHRTWLQAHRRAVLKAPGDLPAMPSRVAHGRIPSLASLKLEQAVDDPQRGGESAARARLEQFLGDAVHDYQEGHERPDRDGTSRLSAYLHFGCISPRAIEDALPGGAGPDAFRRQLCWRDFYHHVMRHFPATAHEEFQDRYRGTLVWRDDETGFSAWCAGETGFPLVDAGMRQLRREGYMHNRVRLVVGSFLTKDLGLDWRRGEAHFMSLLLDGDEANNNGNWQWIASVGVDPQPAFRRIYNPTLQMRRLDPDGEYVRRYVPELRDVPDELLAEPWTMTEAQQREAGCQIGRDYPAPIVDHAQARREALARYAATR
jgi:deoxyribodipyrimidine photo-lyase